MLQTFTNTRPYSQPLSTDPVEGDRFALPPDFVDGLVFLAPFVKRSGDPVETWVHLIAGKLHVVTNSLILEFEIGENDLPDLKFSPAAIRTLEAFGEPPDALLLAGEAQLFMWSNGQELLVDWRQHVRYGDAPKISEARAATLDNYWNFHSGKAVSAQKREDFRRTLSTNKLHKDVYISPRGVIARIFDRKTKRFTSDYLVDFDTNATRAMRFDRRAFAQMVKVATQIDFQCSPVCFHHAGGRGLLIERTLGSDVPDLEVWDG